jgi:hypothetical protein
MEMPMSRYADIAAALPEFRAELLRASTELAAQTVHPLQGMDPSPLARRANVHATGIALSRPDADPDDVVLKVFVFSNGDVPAITSWHGFEVHTEILSVQRKQALPPQRQKRRPIPGGVGTAPLGAGYVGTLGCFLKRETQTGSELLALSNNHVFADVNRLPLGAPICQPGPETAPTSTADIFANLTQFIPVNFSPGSVNDHDAAVARVVDNTLVQTASLFGIPNYAPSQLASPRPGQRVMKSGRTTGVTRGTVTAVNVNGVRVNYAEADSPAMIAVFNNVVRVVGDNGTSFSMPGDSGSLIVSDQVGEPIALLFAGDTVNTFGCSMMSLCNRLNAWPV